MAPGAEYGLAVVGIMVGFAVAIPALVWGFRDVRRIPHWVWRTERAKEEPWLIAMFVGTLLGGWPGVLTRPRVEEQPPAGRPARGLGAVRTGLTTLPPDGVDRNGGTHRDPALAAHARRRTRVRAGVAAWLTHSTWENITPSRQDVGFQTDFRDADLTTRSSRSLTGSTPTTRTSTTGAIPSARSSRSTAPSILSCTSPSRCSPWPRRAPRTSA